MRHVLVHRVRCPVCCGADIMDQWAGNHSLCGVGLATSPGTCAGTRGFIRGKTHANGSPAYESPGAYKTREYGCQFWITRNPYGLPVQPVYTLVSIRALQQQQGGASPTPVTLATVAALAFALTLARRPRPPPRPRRRPPQRPRPRPSPSPSPL